MLKLSVSRNYFGRLFFFATFLFFSPLVFFAAFSFFRSPRFFFFALIFSIRPFSVRGFFVFSVFFSFSFFGLTSFFFHHSTLFFYTWVRIHFWWFFLPDETLAPVRPQQSFYPYVASFNWLQKWFPTTPHYFPWFYFLLSIPLLFTRLILYLKVTFLSRVW